MREMTIGKRFILTSGLCLVLTMVLAVTATYGFRSVGSALSDVVENCMPSNRAGMLLLANVNRLRGDYLGHIASSEAPVMDRIEREISADREQVEEEAANYKKTLDDNDEDRGNFATMRKSLDQIYAGWEVVHPVSRAGKNDVATALFDKNIGPSMQQAMETSLKMVAYNKRVSDARASGAEASATRSLWICVGVGLVALFLGTLVSWFMISRTNGVLREATASLSEGSEQVTSAAGQVSASSQSLAETSSEQAATIQETSATASEINSMANRSSENARTTASIVGQSQKSFEDTGVLLQDLLAAMNGIGVSSHKISKIIKIIDDIAFQTNILALNAAVEAARAGDAGLGFAVVADEVRALAQRSAQAAKDTAGLIEESINQAGAGKTKVDHVAEAMSSLAREISKIKLLIDEIETGSVKQAKGIGQMSNSITQIEQATQNSSASAEEGAAAAEELNTQAQSMRETIQRIKDLVEGGVGSAGSPAGGYGTRRMPLRLARTGA